MGEAISTFPGDKTICPPIANDVDSNKLIKDRKAFRNYLDQLISQHPALFPAEIEAG